MELASESCVERRIVTNFAKLYDVGMEVQKQRHEGCEADLVTTVSFAFVIQTTFASRGP